MKAKHMTDRLPVYLLTIRKPTLYLKHNNWKEP
jgi:hypothetical protein